MHTCSPPKKTLDLWLANYHSVIGNYGHILFEQKKKADDDIISSLKEYFESAHLDARECFHKFARMSLHPDAGQAEFTAQYPNCLPLKTRKGLFGEVMCGMITEAFKFVGEHEWMVPVFLFRCHEDVGQYIYTLSRDSTRTREVLGRKGDDFIGLVTDEDGNVTRFIAGEAKWRKTWNPSSLDAVMLGEKIDDPLGGPQIHNGEGVWFEINRALNVPLGLQQLQDILIDREPENFAEVISSLDRILTLDNSDPVERTDLILLVGGSSAAREERHSLIDWESTPEEYEAGRDLQVVEILIEDGEELITSLYDSLWQELDAEDEEPNAA